MERRTPPQHSWATLLRASFDGALPQAAQAGGSPAPAEASAAVDDLVAKAMRDVERHAASATATKARALALRADAGAALQAAAVLEAASGPGRLPRAAGEGRSGPALDVRR